MKKNLFLFILLSGILFFYNSCKKNSNDEQTVPPVVPDLSTQVITTVSGFITDENGAAVESASIKAGTVIVLTDQYGYFRISNAAFAKSAGYIKVNKAGYFDGYRTFIPVGGKESFVRLQLIPKVSNGIVDAATGGTVTTSNGASVNLPGNAVVVASSNTVYTGTISIAIHWLDPTDQAVTQQTMPGDLRGIDESGYLQSLVTYGMMAVELTGSSGELLQIANGKKASLDFPIPSSLQATAPFNIPLWYFDESKGLWKEEGKAVKNGNKYTGEVSHFSYWNCDFPLPLVNFSAQLVDTGSKPISNIAVSITISGIPNSTHTSYTDANGFVIGMVPANSNLEVAIKTPCNTEANTQTIHTSNQDVNLGSIKIDLSQYGASFKGTVNNCNGLPVTDGYVIITDQGINNMVELVNGVFNASGMICAPGNQGKVIAVDRSTSMLSTVQQVILNSGINDFGTIAACGAVTEVITYVLDGIPYVYTAPQHSFIGSHTAPNTNTWVVIESRNLLNGGATDFKTYWYGNSTGTFLIASDVIHLGTEAYYLMNLNSVSVNVTAFGSIGEPIAGNFSGCILKHAFNNSMHTLSASFNVIRDQ